MIMARKNNITLEDFWTSPLHIMLQLLGVFVAPEKKPVSRKQLIMKERELIARWRQT